MRQYKKYERYKDSGVKWIGEIPEEWETVPLKRIFKIINGGTPSSSEESYWNGEIVWVTPNDLSKLTEACIVDSERKITEDGLHNCSARIVPKGSIVISTRAPIGYVAIAEVPLCTNQGCKSLVAINKVNPKYFYYWMHSISFYLNVLGQGTTFIELSNSSLSMVELLTPSINEQKAIANFLDLKTAGIDGLIADKEKLIELLQEKRQAIITEAVTKGLNPNVRMKDSGIEWIGEIPEHWEVKKLKHVSNITMGQSPKSEECSYDEIGVPFLQGNAEFTNVHPIPKMYCNTANKFSKVNDILLSVRAPVGAINISDRVYGIGRGLCAITAKKVIMKYLWYSLNVSLEELFIKSKGSTFEAVTVTDVQNLLIILPPKNEQDDIVNFLDKKTAEIDGLVIEIKKQIEKLKEYRQSLISEAVTGKIYVRDYAID